MLETNLAIFQSELIEEVNLFTEANKVEIIHRFEREENKIKNTVIVDDKEYNLVSDICFESELEEKRLIKRYAKLSVYRALSEHFGKSMPWGALTGIRPTKLAYQQGENFENFFLNEMGVSKEKVELVKRIINAQKGIYKKDDNNSDFFVGIPFCPSKCAYCSFISCEIAKAEKLIPAYVDALIYEIQESKKLIRNLKSVYIGGGTPVALPQAELKRILDAIGKQNVEYTVEAGRPDCITKENLKLLKEYGVTRICVNPQTFSDETLKILGRKHTVKDVLEKYELAKDMFDINMDLIAGLPGESLEDFKHSIDMAIKLSPENITVHTLCLKKGSKLKENTSRLAENDVIEMVEYSHKRLSENGYEPYYLYRQKYMAGNLENTGYTKPKKACVYNVNIMEEISQNVACGANSVSKAVFNGGERIERVASPKDIKTYIEKLPEVLKSKKIIFESK